MKAVNAKIEQEFSGNINEVNFDNREVYFSVEHIAYEIATDKVIPKDIIEDLKHLYEKAVLNQDFTERQWEEFFENLISKDEVDTFFVRPLYEDLFRNIADKIQDYRKGA